MYHEMFHCLEYSLTKNPKVISIFLNPKKYSKKEKEWAMENAHPLSDSGDWNKACEDDTLHQQKNNFTIEKASKYANKSEAENFAETGSMVAFNDLEDKWMAVQSNIFLQPMKFDDWIKRHPNKYEFILSQLRSISRN